MLIQSIGKYSLLFTDTDNQGSLIALTYDSGAVVEKYAYDPWGARRDPANWQLKDTRTSFITNRGYTGHEHLDAFGIINMNGRVYDPLTAMFFSPDPFIQSPGDWKNYNRYGYCMNNPTRYTDPSGYQLADKNSVWFAPGYENLMSYSSGGGGGSGGGGMGQNMWNSYINVKQDGWAGTYSEFTDTYDANSNSGNGHWVASTVTNWGYTESKGNTYYWSQTNTEVRYVSNSSQNDYPTKDYLSNLSNAAGMISPSMSDGGNTQGGDGGNRRVALEAINNSLGVAGVIGGTVLSTLGTGLTGYLVYKDYKNGGVENINPVDATSFASGLIAASADLFKWFGVGGEIVVGIEGKAEGVGIVLTIYGLWGNIYKPMNDLRYAPLYIDQDGNPFYGDPNFDNTENEERY